MSVEAFPVAPKGGLAGHVERALKQALMEGSLRPGERLVARDLARRLGTSQTPVREALLKLVASGVLEVTPAQSFQVPALSPESYREIADIRKAVESLAAGRAAERVTERDIDLLRSVNARYKSARQRNAVREALHENKEFRLSLYERAAMPTLFSLIETLWLRIGPTLNFLFPIEEAKLLGVHNYDRLIEALARRDTEAVVQLICKAIEEGTVAILRHMPHEADSKAASG